MAVAWTIEGEAGKAWDASTLTFEQRKIENARFDFKSLDVDTFTFRISAQTIASETLPDYTQKVVIYRDGARFFTGHVTNRQVQIDSGKQVCDITVSGPWWWMEKITFTSINTDGTGAASERTSIQFGSYASGQDLKTSILNTIDRCVTLGVPMAGSSGSSPASCAVMTTFPRITLNQSTCAQTFSELVRLCTDAMVFFDYEPELPRIQVTRRKSGLSVGSAQTLNFDQSTGPIVEININPSIEMEVTRVELKSVTRASDGRTQFQTQAFGTESIPLPKRSVITISGPELDTYLPNFKFDTANIGVNSFYSSAVKTLVSQKIGIAENLFAGISPGLTYSWYNSTRCNIGSLYAILNTFGIGSASLRASNGTSLSGYSILTSGTIPSWFTGNVVTNATFTGNIYRYHRLNDGCIGANNNWPLPSNWYQVPWGTTKAGFSAETNGSYQQVSWKSFSITVTALQGSGGTFYAPADYTFINPPTGLAQFLKESADFVPYNGSIMLRTQDVGGVGYRGRCVNISNSMPEFSSMRALVESESMIVETGETTINIGTPARFDYKTLVDRIRRTSQDNIVYL
jgi:hypothetical protein